MSAAAVPRFRSRVCGGLAYRENWWQAARFLAVGTSGLAINMITFALLVHGAGAQYVLAAVCSNLVALGSNFMCNRRWTFGASDGRAVMQASRFTLVSIGGFVVNLTSLQLAVELLALPKLPSEMLACVVAAPVNFLGSRQWAFRAERAAVSLDQPRS